MSASTQQIETQLIEAYARQARKYEEALVVVERFAGGLEQEDNRLNDLEVMKHLLGEVAELDRRIEPTKKRWQHCRVDPGPQLNEQLRRVTDLIGRLLGQVRRAEQRAEQCKNRMIPKLDSAARGKQMQRAYKINAES